MNLITLFLLLNTVWGLDFEAAQNRAQTENKHILLYFSGSDWCGPCISLKKEVFGSEVFNQYAQENLILVQADFPRLKKNALNKTQLVHNEKLAEKYNAKGNFPLTVLINKEGKVLKEWIGFPKDLNAENFIKTLQSLN